MDTIDSLTNGQLGTFVDAIKNKEGKVEKIILKLDKTDAGRHNRDQNPQLVKKYPGCVFIQRVSLQYSTTKKYVESSSKATLIQFPIRLAFAITAHKIQGSSIPFPTTVAMDIDSCFQAGQAYVMLSRVQQLKQVFIVDKISERKFMMSEKAFNELQRLEKISFNRNPRTWNKNQEWVLKIASLNCAGLKAHLEDIKMDFKLLLADILLLQETSLGEEDSTYFDLPSHPVCLHVRKGNGKSVSLYLKEQYDREITHVADAFQIAKISLKGINIVNVYRSSTSSRSELCDKLEELIGSTDESLIFGDFNICGQREKTNSVGRLLDTLGYQQIVKEATHIRGRQIDHLYVKNDSMIEVEDLERYTPYYTDHDALLLSAAIKVN